MGAVRAPAKLGLLTSSDGDRTTRAGVGPGDQGRAGQVDRSSSPIAVTPRTNRSSGTPEKLIRA